jgi:peptidoglycan/LPS O-acetylase OafA/YrhL
MDVMPAIYVKDDKPLSAKPGFSHLPYLDGLRGAAALFVLFNHAYVTVFNNVTCHHPSPSLDRGLGWLANGHDAVDVFIVLSGFCLALPALQGYKLRRGTPDFLRRRVHRIVPPYLCVLLITWLIMAITPLNHATGIAWDLCLPGSRAESIKSAAAHIFLLNDIFARYSEHFGYQLWTIPVEFHIYLLFPLLLLGWRRLGVGRTTAVACIVGLLAAKTLPRLHITANISPTLYSLFALGALGAVISFDAGDRWKAIRLRVPWQPLALVGFMAIAGATVLFFRWSVTYTHYLDYIVGAWAVCAIVSASRSDGSPFYRILSSRPLVAVGKFSYSLYLIHVICYAVFWHYVFVPLRLGDNAAVAGMLCLAAPLTIALAYVFHLAFERPFLNQKSLRPGKT